MSLSKCDKCLTWGLYACASLSAGLVILVAFFLVIESLPAMRDIGIGRFVTDTAWHPADGAAPEYRMTAMLAGTLLATLGAIALAGPLGLLAAIFCQVYAPPRLARPFRHLLGLLAGIPSVVYGFWGLVVLVPLIRQLAAPGTSLLAGAIILAIMILPTVALAADAALAKVPTDYVDAAAALGFSRFGLLWGVVLPAARGGIAVGMVLAVVRALGETMAVVMVCGNVVQVPQSLFAPVRTLTANIALEMAYALDAHRAALFFTGLTLLLLVTGLVLIMDRLSPEPAYA